MAAMRRWMVKLRELPAHQYNDHYPVHLILDSPAAHRAEESRDLARELRTELQFIPAESTKRRRAVNLAVKARYRRTYSTEGETGAGKLGREGDLLA
jgi:hypothetical protein